MGSDTATGTTTALVTASGMTFALVSGNTYRFAWNVLFDSSTTTIGIKLGLTFPAATIVAANVTIPQVVDANNANFTGQITSSGDSVTSVSAPAAATPFLAIVEGTIRPSANGNLALMYGSEVSTSALGVRIKQETLGVLQVVT
jgi:hypothetical protein